MKLLAATVLPMVLLASALGQTNQAGTASAQDSQAIKIIRAGSQPSRQGPAENFTGSVRVEPLFQAHAPARASGSLVTFEPGARTAWHTHPLGQILIVTAGTGRVQRWGDDVDEIRRGDVVWIPPGQKHWHGAAPNSSMAHIGIVEQLDCKADGEGQRCAVWRAAPRSSSEHRRRGVMSVIVLCLTPLPFIMRRPRPGEQQVRAAH